MTKVSCLVASKHFGIMGCAAELFLLTWKQHAKLANLLHSQVGAQGIVWHLGQHATRLAGTLRGKEDFKPVCLSPYFARLLDCPPKVACYFFAAQW